MIEKLKKMTISELIDMAETIDVSYKYLLSIRYGEIKNPEIRVLLKIQSYIE